MAVNKVIYGGETLMDLTGDSLTPETLAEGETAHDASGARIVGTMKAGGGAVQSDWNQTDDTQPDFIKNKTHGKLQASIIPRGDVEFAWSDELSGHVIQVPLSFQLNIGDTLIVTWEGEKYTRTLEDVFGMVACGNIMMNEDLEPFAGIVMDGVFILLDVFATGNTVRNVSVETDTIQKIPSQYMPFTFTKFYATGSDDPYVYLSVLDLTKATLDDISIAASTGSIIIYHPLGFVVWVPHYIDFMNNYVVLHCHDSNGNIMKFHSAEYTG